MGHPSWESVGLDRFAVFIAPVGGLPAMVRSAIGWKYARNTIEGPSPTDSQAKEKPPEKWGLENRHVPDLYYAARISDKKADIASRISSACMESWPAASATP